MRLPRDLSGTKLAKALEKLGYSVTRQSGSHLRLSTNQNGEHHISIPNHDHIKVGTLSIILKEISAHFDITRNELLHKLNF